MKMYVNHLNDNVFDVMQREIMNAMDATKYNREPLSRIQTQSMHVNLLRGHLLMKI